jgi:hypothetical protein
VARELVEVVDVTIKEAWAVLLQILVLLISESSLELTLLWSVNVGMSGDSATSATRRSSCLPMPGTEVHGAERHVEQVKMMVA